MKDPIGKCIVFLLYSLYLSIPIEKNNGFVLMELIYKLVFILQTYFNKNANFFQKTITYC